MEEKRVMEVKVADVVLYTDEVSVEHKALVTAVWGDGLGRLVMPRRKPNPNPQRSDDTYLYETDEHGTILSDYKEEGMHWPSLNLVYVSDDPNKTDQYGRQIERGATSVVHQRNQAAHGRFWRFID
jgi:hypothetical protein